MSVSATGHKSDAPSPIHLSTINNPLSICRRGLNYIFASRCDFTHIASASKVAPFEVNEIDPISEITSFENIKFMHLSFSLSDPWHRSDGTLQRCPSSLPSFYSGFGNQSEKGSTSTDCSQL